MVLERAHPVGVRAALRPPVFAIAGPTIFINVVSSFPYTRDYRFHYSAMVVAGCAVATVEAIAWISNRSRQRLATQASMVSVVLAAAVVASVMLGCAQYSRHYHDGTWPLIADPRVAIKAKAVKTVPARAAASVAYNIDTHMTHRERIYEFPVPWCNVNWGVRGEHLDDPAKVEYLVLDRNLARCPRSRAALGPPVRRVLRRLGGAGHLGREARSAAHAPARTQSARRRMLSAPGARRAPARPEVMTSTPTGTEVWGVAGWRAGWRVASIIGLSGPHIATRRVAPPASGATRHQPRPA